MKKIAAWRGADGQWYITISNRGNGRKVADGGEGYASKANAVRAIKNNFGDGYTFEKVLDNSKCFHFNMIPKVK